jgi:hypothetical protein
MSHDYPRIAEYSLYRRVPVHTFGVCARTSLQGCSMVFPSLLHTRWGFIGGVSTDHQVPPLAPCGSQESPLLYPLIPNQTDPKRVHSIRTTDWYAKLGSTTYYTRSYRTKPWTVRIHRTQFQTHHPKSQFFTLKGNTTTDRVTIE